MSAFTAARERITVRKVDEATVGRLAAELGIPQIAARILVARNLTDAKSCQHFFRPSIDAFLDPFRFADMETAVARILKAIDRGEKIAIYGDYDVDGITGTAMLICGLRQLGAMCDYHLPYRLTDGYGVSVGGVRQIAESGATLMITVDCGITAVNEVALARELGLDVIVTDHHESKEILPAAIALLNPKVASCAYPDRDLAGVGVALKLCQALGQATGRGRAFWEQFLDLAALGTAADIVPLVGENRIIARFGFERMRVTKNIGLAALIELQGLAGKQFSTNEAVFQLAPSINAAGRIGDPRRAVELLLTRNAETAVECARELRNANSERRTIDNTVWDQAEAWVTAHCDDDHDVVIVAGNASWHPGVIGIVASKLVEKFHRPAILFAIASNGSARGSGRSIPGLHLLDALAECADLLDDFGGHAAAAGMSCKSSRIGDFRERFNAVVAKCMSPESLCPSVCADAELPLSAITPELFSCIKAMEPFGTGNMQPVLLCRDLNHRYVPRIVGTGNKHLKMTVSSGARVMDAIAFNFGDRLEEIKSAPAVSLAFALDENEWNGRKSLQMKVKGIAL
jgi:single-stranded-DNA-specific exonuclease